MAQTQVSKRHHYIPEFYLKRWAGGGQLIQFSKPYGNTVRSKRAFPSETGFVDKLYALEGFSGPATSAFEEHYFKPVDTRASAALARMETASPVIDAAERVAWSQFVLSLVLRHPENVTLLKARLRAAVSTITPESERRWKRQRSSADPATLKEAVERQIASDPGSISRAALALAAEGASNDKIGTHLAAMIWGTVTFPADVSALFTSDRPVHWFQPLSSPACHILVPIGPKRAFWAANTDEWAMLITSRPPQLLADFLNQHTVRRAQAYVYAMTAKRLPYVQDLMGADPERNTADRASDPVSGMQVFTRRRNARRKLSPGGSR